MVLVTNDVTWKIVIDLILVACVAIPSIVFKITGSAFQRGFFCDDESIRRPFKGDTIPTWLLIIFFGGITIVIILINEIILRNITQLNRPTFLKLDNEKKCCSKCFLPKMLVLLYIYIGPFVYGAIICQCTTDIGKYMIGRLRPHFIDICKPDWSNISCYDSNQLPQYVMNFRCLGTDTKHIKESHLSHPSGHSSFSFYTMIYLAFYIQKRIKIGWNRNIKVLMQVIALLLCLACSLSRISDYKHHWSDVLGGAIVGTIVAFYTIFTVSIMYRKMRCDVHVENEAVVSSLRLEVP